MLMSADIHHIIWICVLLLRRWPSGENNNCTRRHHGYLFSGLCVRSNLCLHLPCTALDTAQNHFLQPQQGSKLRWLHTYPFSLFIPFCLWFPERTWLTGCGRKTWCFRGEKEVCSENKIWQLVGVWPLMNINDGSKDGVLLPLSHQMKPKTHSPLPILIWDVSTTFYQ